MSKLSAIIAGVAVLPVLALSSPVSAIEPYGSIGGGDIYQSKNVTRNGSFADVTNATCGDTVKLRMYIHNPGPNALENVKVRATLPTDKATSFSSTMTVSASNANPNSESDTTSIKSDKTASLNYVAGTGEYFDANGARLGSLSDTIVTTGADLPGGVAVSTLNARYAQFQAKLNCETTPTPPTTPPTPPTTTTTTKPTTLVKTGAGDVAALFAGVAAIAAVGYNWVLRRQNAR